MTKHQFQNLAWTSTSKSWPNLETLCSKSEQKLNFKTKWMIGLGSDKNTKGPWITCMSYKWLVEVFARPITEDTSGQISDLKNRLRCDRSVHTYMIVTPGPFAFLSDHSQKVGLKGLNIAPNWTLKRPNGACANYLDVFGPYFHVSKVKKQVL